MRGIIVIAAFLVGACGEDAPSVVAQAVAAGSSEAMTLADYKLGTADERAALIDHEIEARDLPADDAKHYVACMGEFAVEKSETLAVDEVFGWCVREAANNRERFESHFNELDAKDLARMAGVICTNFVRDSLAAPSTADFPTFDRDVWRRGGNRYVVKSYVDAQNAYGAQVRADWYCDVTYDGAGNDASPLSWTLNGLEMDG